MNTLLRMRWALPAIAMAAAAFLLMGLNGGESGGSDQAIPIPQKNFDVSITDRSGQTLQASRFTWEGKVHFRAQVGNATVTLPFNKVRSMRVAPEKATDRPELIKAMVTLQTGETVEVLIDRSSKCYGETKFGNYEIFLKDVTSLSFQ